MNKPDYKVQTLLFDINKNSASDIVNFLTKHNYKMKKFDIMENGSYVRSRQLTPQYLRRIKYDEFRTITLDKNKNIKMIVAYKRNSDMTPTIMENPEERVIEGGLLIRKSKYI
jgi:hypothetical protein